jgi:hypothetical protein
VHIAPNQHVGVSVADRHGIVGAAITHQRQRTDPPSTLVTGIIPPSRGDGKNAAAKLGSFRYFFYDVIESKAFLTPEKRFRNEPQSASVRAAISA